MNRYEHLEGKREQILQALKDMKSYSTIQKGKSYLGGLYYRYCKPLPTWLQRYNAAAKEKQIERYIKQKLRCPNCVKRVENYFLKYASDTRTDNK